MSNTDAEWMEQYMEAHPPQDKEVEVEVEVLARPAGWPFIRKDILHISPEHLSHWVRSEGDIKTGPTAAARILKSQGGTPSGLSQRAISPGREDQTYRFWKMHKQEGQDDAIPQNQEAQDQEAQDQEAQGQEAQGQEAQEKKCKRCGPVGQYSHGDGLLCVDCLNELVSFQRVPCSCGAQAGEPCRTKSGKVISTAHKPRLAALDELNRKE